MIIGVIKIICAITMACGVYSSPSQPNGPDLDKCK